MDFSFFQSVIVRSRGSLCKMDTFSITVVHVKHVKLWMERETISALRWSVNVKKAIEYLCSILSEPWLVNYELDIFFYFNWALTGELWIDIDLFYLSFGWWIMNLRCFYSILPELCWWIMNWHISVLLFHNLCVGNYEMVLSFCFHWYYLFYPIWSELWQRRNSGKWWKHFSSSWR